MKVPLDTLAEDANPSAAQAAIRSLRDALDDAGRRLRESEERWELLVLATEEGIWDWVPGTDQMYWSSQFTRMLGYTDGQIAPSVAAFNTLLHPDDAAAVWRAFDEHVAGKTPLFEAEFRLRAHDGLYRWIRSRGKAKVDDRGTAAVRMIGLHADITARKQMAAEGATPPAPKSTESLEPPAAKTHCRNCNSDMLVRSRWRLWERPLIFLLVRPARCRCCGRRSFKPLWARVPRASHAYRKYLSTPSES